MVARVEVISLYSTKNDETIPPPPKKKELKKNHKGRRGDIWSCIIPAY